MIKEVFLGISGGIAAYKACTLIRLLKKAGIGVKVVLTKNAFEFVTKITIETLSQEPCCFELFANPNEMTHLKSRKLADVFVIAPATANVIAKLACGLADDLLTSSFLAYEGPKLVVPAMNSGMYNNPVTLENIEKLRSRGIEILGPDKGVLACEDVGIGRMVEPELILQKIKVMSYPKLPLPNKKILITAGGTREKIDSVRVITNLSSGKLGHNLAHMAALMGAKVSLVTTCKSALINPEIKDICYVESSEDMYKEVLARMKNIDCLYMAAAVSDFVLKEERLSKIKKQDELVLDFKKNRDILAKVGELKKQQKLIGFCLEDQNLEAAAKDKLQRKNLDYIVANKSEVIGKDIRSVQIYDKSGLVQAIDKADLLEISYQLLKLML